MRAVTAQQKNIAELVRINRELVKRQGQTQALGPLILLNKLTPLPRVGLLAWVTSPHLSLHLFRRAWASIGIQSTDTVQVLGII